MPANRGRRARAWEATYSPGVDLTRLPPKPDRDAARADRRARAVTPRERRRLLRDADRLRRQAAESEDPAMRETLIVCAEVRDDRASPPALRLVPRG